MPPLSLTEVPVGLLYTSTKAQIALNHFVEGSCTIARPRRRLQQPLKDSSKDPAPSYGLAESPLLHATS